MYDEFNSKVMEWLKSRIRDIIENPKGDFVSDKIDQDTYFQLREFNHITRHEFCLVHIKSKS